MNVMRRLLHNQDLLRVVVGPADLILSPPWRQEYHQSVLRTLLAQSLVQNKRQNNRYLYATDGSAYGNLSAAAAVAGRLNFTMQMPEEHA